MKKLPSIIKWSFQSIPVHAGGKFLSVRYRSGKVRRSANQNSCHDFHDTAIVEDPVNGAVVHCTNDNGPESKFIRSKAEILNRHN